MKTKLAKILSLVLVCALVIGTCNVKAEASTGSYSTKKGAHWGKIVVNVSVKDELGNPIKGANVHMEYKDRTNIFDWHRSKASGVTNSNGEYSFSLGTNNDVIYNITASRDGFESYEIGTDIEIGTGISHPDEVNYNFTLSCAAMSHKAGAAVRENEVAAKCGVAGSYDEVVYCTQCGKKLSSTQKSIAALEHDWVLDEANSVAATCTEDGYDLYVCSHDATHTDMRTVKALGHTNGNAVVENEVAATCTANGSYDSVIYCTVCDAEISRDTISTDKLDHVSDGQSYTEAGEAATCTKAGFYYVITKCACGEELSRETVTIPATECIAAEAVEENRVEATCAQEGSYDLVVYCTECGEEISRTSWTIEKSAHTHETAVEENRVEATCTEAGSYDSVVYCKECNEEVSRTAVEIPATGHTWGEAEEVEGSRVAPTCTEDGSYTTVIKCTVCGAEKEDSSETHTVPATGHKLGEWSEIKFDGNKYYQEAECENCDYVETRDVVYTETAPTCEADGRYAYTVDGNEIASGIIDKLGHDWSEWTETKAATYDEEGLEERHCTRKDCSAHEENSIDKLVKPEIVLPILPDDYNKKNEEPAVEEPVVEEPVVEEVIDDIEEVETAQGDVEEEPVVEEPVVEEPVVEEPVVEEPVVEEIIDDIEEVETAQGDVEDEEEDIELDDMITPQGDVLPQTGVASAALFLGLGAACIGFGGAIVAKAKKKED